MKLKLFFLTLLAFSEIASAEFIEAPTPDTHFVCDTMVNQYGRKTEYNCREVPGAPIEADKAFWPIKPMNQDPEEVISVHKDEGGWVYVRRRNGQSEIWSETSPGHYEKN